jgi:single-strand DNA-binding protein
MATYNRTTLVGRLTRDPETRSFASGGKVCQMGFAVSNRKKVGDQWQDSPLFIEVKAFNSQYGQKLADICEQYLHKGSQALIDGRLELESWEKDGQKHSKIVLVAQTIQLLDPRPDDGQAPAQQSRQAPQARTAQRTAQRPAYDAQYDPPAQDGGDIPF